MSEGNEKKEVEKEVEDGGAKKKPSEAEVPTGDEKNVQSGAVVSTDATGEVGEERKSDDGGLKPNVESEDVKEAAKVDGGDAAPEKKVEAASFEIIGSGDGTDGIKVDGDDVACGSAVGLEKSENAAGEVKLEIDERNGAEKQPNPENVTENVKEERNVETGNGAHGNTPEKENVEMTNGEVKENTAQAENAKDGGTVNVKEELALVSVQMEDGETRADTRAKEVQSGDGQLQGAPLKLQTVACEHPVSADVSNQSYIWDTQSYEGDGAGTEEEQAAFMRELETFHKEKNLEFKPPKFYGEGLNCLKLWRAVTRLGGYDQVTSCKLWRQVGESFNPPKTCTTVSWSFRCFYEKALLEYEKHKIRIGELPIPLASSEPISIDNQTKGSQAPGSGRTIRDAAARAMQGWHSQRLLGNGEVGDPIIKDKNSISLLKRDKQLKNVGLFKRKKTSPIERSAKVARTKPTDQQTDAMVVDVGPPADWVKINVRRTKDCFEIYALVPGLLREEVHVQSDPAGRLVISGEPEQIDNPWGVTPFKKVVTLPSRIDPHQTSAVVTLHGQLFVRAPFEQDNVLVGV